MHLSFIKYCKRENSLVESDGVFLPKSLLNLNSERIFSIMAGKTKPTDLEIDKFKAISEILNTCYEIEVMCFYYNHLLKEYRITSKGGKLLPNPEMGVYAYVNADLQYLINLYDERIRNTNILSSVGGYATINTAIIDQMNKNQLALINYQENVELIDTRPMIESLLTLSNKNNEKKNEITFMEKDFISNYVPTKIGLTDFYEYSKIFRDNFIEYYRFNLEDFIVFLIVVFLDIFHSIGDEPHGFVHLLQRGYSLYNIDTLKENYFKLIEDLYNDFNFVYPEEPESTFNLLFSFFNNTKESATKIQFETFGPRGIFYEINNQQGMVDHTSFLNIISHILDPIIKNNDMKGIIFEKIVKEKVIELFGEESLWKCQSQVKAGKKNREIDVSFLYDDVLYILECKAVNLSWGFFKGDKKAIDFRKMKNKKAIVQADKTINFIFENKDELNYKIPANVKNITSLIITPHPEFIWERQEQLFVYDSMPRILSINELNYIKGKKFGKEVVNRSFSMQI